MLAMFMSGGLFSMIFLLFILPLYILFVGCMLIDAVKNTGLSEGEKIGWVLAIVFLHLVGSVLYFFIGHPKQFTPRLGSENGLRK
jgi:hypothetical protein